jgi:hypothetical protein
MTLKKEKNELEGQMGNIGTWRMLRIFPAKVDFSGFSTVLDLFRHFRP